MKRREQVVATETERPTLRITNIPQTIIAEDLLKFLQFQLGADSVFAIEISTDRVNWKSRGFGRVQFTTLEVKSRAHRLSLQNDLVFKSHYLRLSETYDDIIPRPIRADHRNDGGILHVGFMTQDDRLHVLERWEGVRGWLMPERRRIEFWVLNNGEYDYKLDVLFDDIVETVGYRFNGSVCTGLLLRVKYAPRIYQKVSGPNVTSKFSTDRYHICKGKEKFDFLWVRTTDFSLVKSIGQSTSFYWEINPGLSMSDMFTCFPCYREDMKGLVLENGKEYSSGTDIVPLVKCPSGSKLAYEILFQLNSLVHTQKISIAAIDTVLIDILSGLPVETAVMILQMFLKLQYTCYNPVTFVKERLAVYYERQVNSPSSSFKRLMELNVMTCHRALVSPTKIYCLGPELESSNYVVKNFAEYASDFMRVTFVEEDWSKLSAKAISCSVQSGIFSKPFRTKIYHRILSVLQDGIVIGDKHFEFLAFSASQLRSNSVWMFASNDKVKAKDIRDWMGNFKKIRSISKCAARMGQLFSSSLPTLVVPPQDVEIIPDIEVTSDGINYCFSDGIGKVSLSFAKQIAQKCGLDHLPSAFQIRYGGYKGVVAVDRNSFQMMSLRRSMFKFDSQNNMLNITKWSESMPCFLNREIISLLSTLGIKDEVFERMQQDQLCLLGKMLTNREAALNALLSLGGAGSRNMLVKMLLRGYEPNVEPYLSMMILAHYETLLSDLISRCRIFVPKGRVLIGCLDETGILNYGQVFVRVSIKNAELESGDKSFFHRVDEETAIVIGKVVVTKNPCLHPGDVRVLEAVYDAELEEKGLVDCLLFPQKGERPHPNECSGGDLDGDQFFISWDENVIPCQTDSPMDYTGGRPRIMDHVVTLEEIQKFFVDYMINDNLGAISTAHLVHADREPDKARSEKCLELANLHSMAVDFAKTGAPAQMPLALKPREFPDFMQRREKPMYTSLGALGKLYRAAINSIVQERENFVWSKELAEVAYDSDLEVNGFEAFLPTAQIHKDTYSERMSILMKFYGVEAEDEILTGNMRNKAMFLQRDNRRYGEMKERIVLSVKNLQREAKEWFESSCKENEHQRLASAWYHVTYHPNYVGESMNFLSFPWIVGDLLLDINSVNNKKNQREQAAFSQVYIKSPRRPAMCDESQIEMKSPKRHSPSHDGSLPTPKRPSPCSEELVDASAKFLDSDDESMAMERRPTPNEDEFLQKQMRSPKSPSPNIESIEVDMKLVQSPAATADHDETMEMEVKFLKRHSPSHDGSLPTPKRPNPSSEELVDASLKFLDSDDESMAMERRTTPNEDEFLQRQMRSPKSPSPNIESLEADMKFVQSPTATAGHDETMEMEVKSPIRRSPSHDRSLPTPKRPSPISEELVDASVKFLYSDNESMAMERRLTPNEDEFLHKEMSSPKSPSPNFESLEADMKFLQSPAGHDETMEMEVKSPKRRSPSHDGSLPTPKRLSPSSEELVDAGMEFLDRPTPRDDVSMERRPTFNEEESLQMEMRSPKSRCPSVEFMDADMKFLQSPTAGDDEHMGMEVKSPKGDGDGVS